MNKAIFTNELRLYLFSWMGWIALLILNLIAAVGMFSGIAQYGLYIQLFYLIEMPLVWCILIVGSRTLSRDRELGVFSLFFTSPIKIQDLFFAKFLGLVFFFTIGLLTISFFPIVASFFVKITWISIFSCMLAVFMQIILFSSIALFSSSCSTNSLIAIVISFSIWISFNLLNSMSGYFDPNFLLTKILKNLSYTYHFNNINSGNFSLADILYYIIGALFFIKLSESKVLSQIAR
ncbi:MAG: ABC transporter permease [Brevinema sp.]